MIQAPNHVAGRTLRCFKCLTPFTVPKMAGAPMAQFAPSAPAPMAAFPSSPAAAPAAFPVAPTPPREPEAAPEFELDPVLAGANGAAPGGGGETTSSEELEVLDEVPGAGDSTDELPSTEDVAWEDADAALAEKKKPVVPAGDGSSLLHSCALLQEEAFLLKHNIAFLPPRLMKFSLLNPGSKDVMARGKERFNFMRFLPIIGSFCARVIEFREDDKGPVVFSFRIRKPLLSFTMSYEVFDDQARMLGYFKSKLFANFLTGGGFWLYDAQGQQVAETKNKGFFSMNARCAFFSADGRELGAIVDEVMDTMKKKKFALVFNPGWVLKIADEVQGQPQIKVLLIAAGLALELNKSKAKQIK